MSGYLNINKGGSALGFVFYGREGATRASLKNYPTILWLNGGPAVSSLRANFMEVGPHIVRPATMAPYEVVKNNYTWVKEYNVIFVDSPVGTGLSYADPTYSAGVYCKNINETSSDLFIALKELYLNPNGCFNKLGITGANALFVLGQSYGGKFAAGIGQKIKYEQLHNGGFLTGLKGVAIGSGFLHPYHLLSQVG
jgi:vitellogenic carboxypeptidase-like protein